MKNFRKILLIAYIAMIIGHFVLYYRNEESFTSFVWGVVAMICLIISLLFLKKNEQ